MTKWERTQTEDNEIIYLDNAATTFPKPESVYAEANAFYTRYGGNAGRGGNPLARACTRLLTETRELLAEWLDAPSYESVIFTASATHALIPISVLRDHSKMREVGQRTEIVRISF